MDGNPQLIPILQQSPSVSIPPYRLKRGNAHFFEHITIVSPPSRVWALVKDLLCEFVRVYSNHAPS
jgi:hypothetical protein